jgi:photosystem II stability/assembly factor-like uncharacterized protein
MKPVAVVVAVLVTLIAAGAGLTLPSGASALTPNGDQGWFWQMPQPFGGGLSDVTFGSDHDVWAVGGGRIAHSADAGATWAVQAVYPKSELYAVAFSDALHGYACGVSGAATPLVLKTVDGGTTWVKLNGFGSGGLDSVTMTDAEHVWISGPRRLWVTSDGGASWVRRTVHNDLYLGPMATTTVDGSRGWAGGSGGRVWRTVDGGATWRAQATGLAGDYLVYRLASTDAAHAWALAYRFSAQGPRSVLIATSDGGATWRRLEARSGELATSLYVKDEDDFWLIGLQFDDPLELLLAPLVGAPVRLRHTVDGGATWTTMIVDSTSPPMALAGSGDALCAVGMGAFTSADGGLTWQPRSGGDSYLFVAAQAVSATDVWAVDEAGALLHSADGARWVEQDAPARWDQSLRGVSFSDAQHGWVVGAGGTAGDAPLILRTLDGGGTWHEQTPPLPAALAGVDFVDAKHGWVFAGNGPSSNMLARTTDGGVTWLVQRPHSGLFGLSTVDFIDTDTGWAAGQYDSSVSGMGSGIFRTVDAGKTWTTSALPRNQEVEQLRFPDKLHGWAIVLDQISDSSSQYVMHTGDGGKTWTRLTGFSGRRPTALHFLDALTGWVAVSGEGVYKTTDGGVSWALVSIAGSGETSVLTASDATHVWALGLGELLGTVDATGDTAAPQTWTDGDGRWTRSAQTLTLTAGDIGGSGLARTEYSLDDGKSWLAGTSMAFAAPADHSNDGAHTVRYRSIDGAGNREATKLTAVLIDTLGPACGAPKKAVVNAGSKGILRFLASDATSGVGRAVITIRDQSGKVRRTFVRRAGNWGTYPAPTYYWLRFRCDLRPGTYRITVTATDRAGNTQTKIGHNVLRVVRRGAPQQRRPWWPAGLPGDTLVVSGGSSPAAAALAAAAGTMAGGSLATPLGGARGPGPQQIAAPSLAALLDRELNRGGRRVPRT